MGGDFNAKAREWGSREGNRRGDLLLELTAALDLCVENVGSTPTFQDPMGESVPDVTFSRLSGPHGIEGWSVLENTFSDIITTIK